MKRLMVLLSVVGCLAAGMSAPAGAVTAGTPAAGALPAVVTAAAYAGYLQVPAGSSVASVGPLFPVTLGCNLVTDSDSASAAAMQLGPLVHTGAVSDTVSSTHTAASVSGLASASVQGVQMLAGLITADAVTATASSQALAGSASSMGDATFTNLVIAGVSISAHPAPNTTIALPGLGTVVLNEQVGPINGADHTRVLVNAIDVHVTLANGFGLPIGSTIILAHAASSITRTTILAAVSAHAYGLLAVGKAGSGFATSGPWALAKIGCTGGKRTVSVASVNVPGVASTGTITDTAFGQIAAAGPHAGSRAQVQGLSVLTGLISAALVTSRAQASITGGAGVASATTTLLHAMVAGVALAAHPAPNTRITLANLGYVIVNEQQLHMTATRASAVVNAFDLHVTTANGFGLPVGTRIIVGHADAMATTA